MPTKDKVDEDINKTVQSLILHTKAMACHCECLGMNAANMWSVIANTEPPYTDAHYYQIMQKWGLINKDGNPTF